MGSGKWVLIALVVVLAGCAQVPKESVELSATVGRDISEIRKSHIAFVDLYYQERKEEINRFIDTVYLPYLIRQTLTDDFWIKELLSAFEAAGMDDGGDPGREENPSDALTKIEIFLLIIQEEVEAYRKIRLQPVEKQHAEVRAEINASYDQVHYANAIVTGHLASVVKVHDTQNKMLAARNLDGMRSGIGEGLAGMSDRLNELVRLAESGEDDLDTIIDRFDALIQEID